AHGICSGMGGMRIAGDLVARMQLARQMRIKDAKAYVADKLNCTVADLTDPIRMTEIRDDLQIGLVTPQPGHARGIEAKMRMAEVLGIEINCVRRFREKTAK
ncbi:MAG: [dimethylamine--corrinoid protein] Co-methyltransferase, partial [Deltaproteobacteria bacterium]|nr:[dimethylamine--corrinoid protein] Co-methyltransferase [Deltaproteobacteria bacterium]